MSDEGFIIYSLEEGGVYRVKRGTRAMFDEVRASGEMLESDPRFDPVEFRVVRPAYIAWAPIADDFDFVLGRPR